MRAITVRQPWAWAIVHGGKDVENRTRNIAGTYRGPVAIHAGLTPDTAAQGHWPPRDLVPMKAWQPRGVVIGVVDLVEVHFARSGDYEDPCGGYDDIEGECLCSPWAGDLMHHLVLANPRPLAEPIPYRGRLGLWIPGARLQEAVAEQVAL